MWLYLLIALGGALGSVARYGMNSFISAQAQATMFPWGTLIVNVSGSFIIGFFYTITEPAGRLPASPNIRQFFMTGICGGYTTFSSFSLQTLHLAREGEWLRAGTNTVGSVVSCLIAVWLGHLLASYLNQMKGS
jgi:CrcB protein